MVSDHSARKPIIIFSCISSIFLLLLIDSCTCVYLSHSYLFKWLTTRNCQFYICYQIYGTIDWSAFPLPNYCWYPANIAYGSRGYVATDSEIKLRGSVLNRSIHEKDLSAHIAAPYATTGHTNASCMLVKILKSKTISNDEELTQSDPISCLQNQKRNN